MLDTVEQMNSIINICPRISNSIRGFQAWICLKGSNHSGVGLILGLVNYLFLQRIKFLGILSSEINDLIF